MKFQSTKKGFTLLELVLVLAISAILIACFSLLMNQGLHIMRQVESYDETYLESSFAMDYMEREVRQARGIYTSDVYPLHYFPYKGIGFVLEIDDALFVTYASYNGQLFRMTTRNPLHFGRIQENISRNLLASGFQSVDSIIDASERLLTLRMTHEQQGDYVRMIPVTIQEGEQ